MSSKYSEEQIKQATLALLMEQISSGQLDPSCRDTLRKSLHQARKFAIDSLDAAAKVVSDRENALASIQANSQLCPQAC